MQKIQKEIQSRNWEALSKYFAVSGGSILISTGLLWLEKTYIINKTYCSDAEVFNFGLFCFLEVFISH